MSEIPFTTADHSSVHPLASRVQKTYKTKVKATDGSNYTRGEKFSKERFISRLLKKADTWVNPLNNPLYVDPASIPDGLEHGWIRHKIGGKDDLESLQQAAAHHWEPAPIELFPQFKMMDIEGNLYATQGIVERGDALLCVRPAIIGEKEKKVYIDRANQQLRDLSLPNSFTGRADTHTHNFPVPL